MVAEADFAAFPVGAATSAFRDWGTGNPMRAGFSAGQAVNASTSGCRCADHAEENKNARLRGHFLDLAERTGLEPATPGVTGRYSNQLNYHSNYLNFFRLLY